MNNRVFAALALAACLICVPLAGTSGPAVPVESEEGNEPWGTALVPAVEATFERESYLPGDHARLVVADRSRSLSLQVFESGPERVPTKSNIFMRGVPVSREWTVTRSPGRQLLSLPIREWDSGLYFVRLRAADGRLGFAPFVVAPRHIGEHRVAVVLPTLTWQAYNFRDDDGDGLSDTWYARKDVNSVRLGRAFLDRGVPYGFRNHLGFLNWLHWTHRDVDFLSQWDLEHATSATTLAKAYDLIVFEGHHEYVTTREYDLVEGYRNLGGNLLFLSANNFFWRVDRKGDVLVRVDRWRNLDRPEAALIGVQYIADQRSPRAAWVVRRTSDLSWMLRATQLRVGSRFGRGGVEIDQVTRDSPRSVRVVAEIPNLFGPGMTAQMAYYETDAGARVFAAGAFHLMRNVTTDSVVWRLLENIWARLATP
jgi:N,N-dimethylformamidase beta subunit-like protein